ncbi:MAG: ABC transporter permease [Solirubrobacteraceae bacterium]
MEEAEHLAHRIVVMDAGMEVAQGTAAELKDRLGGDVLEARVSSASDLDRAAALIAELGQGVPRVDADQRTVSMPTKGATQVLIAAGQRLQQDGIALEDLGIRHPSLDDVFLSLTGNAAQVQPNGAHPDGRAPDHPDRPSPDVPDASTKQPETRPAAPRVPRLTAGAVRDTGGVARRNLLRILRNPRLLVFSAVQPAMLLVLFRYVLGGAIHIPGGSYVDYIVPAVFIEAVMIGGMATAIGLADDLGSGIIDRFRSLPMARSAVLAGRTLADLSRSVFALALMVVLGLLVGFSFHAGAGGIVAGLGLVLVFGYCFSWVYATIGLLTKDPETAQVAGILPFFVLVFASSAIVPVATMPGWLQPFARHQPVSITINAVRALLQGEPTHHWVWQSLAWSAGILLVFFTIAVRLYRNVAS